MKAKKDLIAFIMKETGLEMDAQTLTLGFARRATAYKRATLIFSDLERLRRVNKGGSLQLVFAGKAHPKDQTGKSMIQEIYSYISRLKGETFFHSPINESTL